MSQAEDIPAFISIPTEPARDPAGNQLFRLPLGPDDIFVDSPASPERGTPGVVILGISLVPIVRCPGSGDHLGGSLMAQRKASRFCDACGVPVNAPEGKVPEHEATPDAIAAYGIDVQHGALYLEADRGQIEALQAQLQRVIDDNDWDVPA